MSYQVPSTSKAEVLLGETTTTMYRIKPSKVLILNHVIVTMFIKGHVGSDFKMKLNVYKDANGNNLLLSSTAVNNLQIDRTGDYYVELRFDFPKANNRMAVDVDHLLEFEIYDGYTYDTSNYVALIIDTQSAQNYLGSDVLHTGDATRYGHKMSMFLGEVLEQTDEKFFLVKMDGAKLLNAITTRETHASFVYGFVYIYHATIQTNLWIDLISSDAFSLSDDTTSQNFTRVFEVPTYDPLDEEAFIHTYYYNPQTGDFYFCTYPNFTPDNNYAAILKYSLFFTNYVGRYADPYMEEFPLVTYWEPRLEEGLSFDFSQQNNFNGLLSITASTIELKNHDKYFNDFFSANDTFNNRQVKVWRCVGGTDISQGQATLEFVGSVRAASLTDSSCSFEIQDILSTLDKTYEDGLPITFGEIGYASALIKAEDQLKVVPRMFGRRGPYETELYDTGESLGGAVNYKIPVLNGDKMTEMVNVSRSDTFATNTNRTWCIGFGPAGVTDESFDCTLHTHLVLSSFNASILTIDTTANGGLGVGNYFAPGDTIKNGTQYGIVYATSDTEIYVWPYNASFSAANAIVREKVGAVVILNGSDKYYALGGRDYNTVISIYGDVCITFTNNFEATLGMPTLDPDSMQVFGRLYNDSADGSVSAILEEILGYTDNLIPAGDFAPAQQPGAYGSWDGQSYPDPICSFTLPFVGQSSMPTFREVIEVLLKTGMGMLYFTSQGLVGYKSFMDSIWINSSGEDTSQWIDNQSGVDPDVDGIDATKTAELSVQFDLYDLFTGVDFTFSHNPNLYSATEQSFGTNDVNLGVVRRFYKTNKKYAVEIVADRNASHFNNYIYKYVKLVCGRRASYSLKAFTTWGIYLGDDLLVSRAKIVGSSNSSYMRVVSLGKGSNEQKLTLLDLKRFPGL